MEVPIKFTITFTGKPNFKPATLGKIGKMIEIIAEGEIENDVLVDFDWETKEPNTNTSKEKESYWSRWLNMPEHEKKIAELRNKPNSNLISISYLQRTFGLGFARAGKIFDKMIEDGAIVCINVKDKPAPAHRKCKPTDKFQSWVDENKDLFTSSTEKSNP